MPIISTEETVNKEQILIKFLHQQEALVSKTSQRSTIKITSGKIQKVK